MAATLTYMGGVCKRDVEIPPPSRSDGEPRDRRVYVVEGMTCEHCRVAVAEEVGALAGVTEVEVDLASGRLTVRGRRRRRRRGGRRGGRGRVRGAAVRTPAAWWRSRAVLGVTFGAAALGGRGPRPAARARRRPRPRRRDGRRATAGGPPRPGAGPRGGRGRLRPGPDATTLPRGAPRELHASASSAPDGRAVTRLRRRARAPDAPDRRAPRPHRLPAPAPDPRRRRPLERVAAAARGRRVPRLRRLPHRRPADDPRHRPLRRRRVPPGALARPERGRHQPARTAPSCRRRRRRGQAGHPGATRSAAAGGPLAGVEPYLGADGHLVALREGDLAFLHVHPEESDTPGTIRFAAELPSAGRYRLFLQFTHDGRVTTVAHTRAGDPMSPPRRPAPSASSCRSPA